MQNSSGCCQPANTLRSFYNKLNLNLSCYVGPEEKDDDGAELDIQQVGWQGLQYLPDHPGWQWDICWWKVRCYAVRWGWQSVHAADKIWDRQTITVGQLMPPRLVQSTQMSKRVHNILLTPTCKDRAQGTQHPKPPTTIRGFGTRFTWGISWCQQHQD